MKLLVLRSWFLLLYCDALLRLRGFSAIHAVIRGQKVHSQDMKTDRPWVELCHAVDLACVFYFKRVRCLQRSAAGTLLLRRHGWAAEMVIGAQMLPFKSHAWVEISGAVVNDKPYMLEMYLVLERC